MKFSLPISSAVFVLTYLLIRIVGSGQPFDQCPLEDSAARAGPQRDSSAIHVPAAISVNDAERTYIVRVVSADSQVPVTNAKVQVEFPDKSRKYGRTDNTGIFWFQWRSATKTVRVHISVQARGFIPLDDFRALAEDTLIKLDQNALVNAASGGK